MLAREPSDVQGFFNTENWLRALRQSRDLDQEPLFPPPTGVPHTPSLVSVPLWSFSLQHAFQSESAPVGLICLILNTDTREACQ